MSTFEIVSILVAFSALCISCIAVIFSGIQTKKASDALLLQQQLIRGNVIEHFTGRFFDLLKEGELHKKIKEEEWAYQFWSLLSTEFYFFHHGILPHFMFTLWMIDLSNLYAGSDGKEIKQSHKKYLDTYSFLYEDMTSFFDNIHQISQENTHDMGRNKAISEFTMNWYQEHKQKIL